MRAIVLAAALLVATTAHAQNADQLFAKGKALLAKKKYAEACPTFEKVDALDPGIGAKLNVARCYQEWGKLVRAERWYTDAAKMATDAKDDRADKIKELLAELEPDIPKLTIKAPAGADLAAAAIALDSEPLGTDKIGRELRVDPGPHEITYKVDGVAKTKTIAMERGGAREVALELPVAEADKDPGTTVKPDDGPRPPPGPHPGRTRRIVAFVLMGAGAASLGVSGYLGLDARDTYRNALETHCMNMKTTCSDEGLRITSDARSRANVATVFAVAGLAVAAGGVVLYLTAPKGGGGGGEPESLSRSAAIYVAPAIGDGGGGLVLGGRY